MPPSDVVIEAWIAFAFALVGTIMNAPKFKPVRGGAESVTKYANPNIVPLLLPFLN